MANKHLRFQRAFWLFAQIIVGTAIRLFNNYHCKITRPKGSVYLALYNHTDDLDPLYMAICLFRHMRYVASSVILKGFTGKLISLLLGPIPRPKAASADETVALILENLKAGISIGMSAEGNRSWDGETMYISPRTAEVAKQSGAGLVTFRVRGGFLHTPRFAANKRKGPVFGEMVHEYSAEELAKMSVEEIAKAIADDLYVNAYQDQLDPPPIIREYLERKSRGRNKHNASCGDAEKESRTAGIPSTGMIPYKGRSKAENIESILFICPECHGIGTLSSHGDEFGCTCGLHGRVNDYGFLEGALPYNNTVDWNRWQKAYLKEHVAGLEGRVGMVFLDAGGEATEHTDLHAGKEPIFTDQGADVYLTKDNERKLFAQSAEVLFYPDHLEVRGEKQSQKFRLDSISKFGAFRSKKIFFQAEAAYCELDFDHIVSGMKYEAFWRVLTERPYF